jgi:hypothetical protein
MRDSTRFWQCIAKFYVFLLSQLESNLAHQSCYSFISLYSVGIFVLKYAECKKNRDASNRLYTRHQLINFCISPFFQTCDLKISCNGQRPKIAKFKQILKKAFFAGTSF